MRLDAITDLIMDGRSRFVVCVTSLLSSNDGLEGCDSCSEFIVRRSETQSAKCDADAESSAQREPLALAALPDLPAPHRRAVTLARYLILLGPDETVITLASVHC